MITGSSRQSMKETGNVSVLMVGNPRVTAVLPKCVRFVRWFCPLGGLVEHLRQLIVRGRDLEVWRKLKAKFLCQLSVTVDLIQPRSTCGGPSDFETGSHSITSGSLEFTMWTKLALNSHLTSAECWV